MAEEKKTIVEKLHAISTPAKENWLEIADKWEEEDKVLEELIKYFQGLWPGMETANQCNTDMHFTPPAIMRLVRHFAEWGAEHAKKETPVSEDLEEATARYGSGYCDIGLRRTAEFGFKSGAEWQKSQMIRDCSVQASYEAEIEKAEERGYNLCKEQMGEQARKELFKDDLTLADLVAFDEGCKIGRRLERQDMLKGAVEGYVNYYEDGGGKLMAEAQVGCPYHIGDKVKIIIVPIKEDKE